MKENEKKILEKLGREFKLVPQIWSGSELNSVMSSLEVLSKEGLVELRKEEVEEIELSAEGRDYLNKGVPERRLLKAVEEILEERGGTKAEMQEVLSKAGLSQSEKGISLQWAIKDGMLKIRREGENTFLEFSSARETDTEKGIKEVSEGRKPSEEIISLLKARKLIEVIKRKKINARITEEGEKELQKSGGEEVTRLTPEMIKTGAWKERKFKEYSLETLVKRIDFGKKHFYKEFVEEIKEKLICLGFREVEGPIVELEFWNMDALFMAQDHPAREIHDVFKIREPSKGRICDEESFKKVFEAHLKGGKTGSVGWGYRMNRGVSESLILRSHDTGISARKLRFDFRSPDKVFFIAHAFRPDEIDWKHFIEFNQLGGYVTDESINLREMLGYLQTFATEVFGAKEVRFVPSYFPFTEPSVELLVNIPGKGWTEMGGAGLFRPEMLEALGVKHPVVAWGLGIERSALIKLGLDDMRKLRSQDIEFLKSK